MLEKNESIYSVIISFNPNIDNINNICKKLNVQNVTPIIIDNGTLDTNSVEFLSNNAIVNRLDDNVGIAKAQNIGIQIAKSKGADYIIFFDQDSEIDDDFVPSLIKDFHFANKHENGKVATIGPVFTDSRYGFYYKVLKISKFGFRKKIDPKYKSQPFPVSVIISSGSLIPVPVFDLVGTMDESLFIDYVDTEWCLRATHLGLKVYVATSAKMSHAIGDGMVNLYLFNVPIHSPFRRYYRIRNAIFLSKMKHIPFFLKVRENIFNIIHQFVLIITQKKKREYFNVIFRAIIDGLKNK